MQSTKKDANNKRTNSAQRRIVPLNEKIEIFERFAKTGGELNGQTVYEGHPIGRWATIIRSSVSRGRITLTQKQKDRLDTIGILENERISIDEKIGALVEWNDKYPKAKILGNNLKVIEAYASSKEEYDRLVEEYSQMQEYYEYVRVRKGRGKLTPEQEEKCREGNVRGVFGYPTKTEEFARKYRMSTDMADEILCSYDSMFEFVKEYFYGEERNSQIGDKIIRHYIDIDFNPNSNCYEALIGDMIRGIPRLIIYSSEGINQAVSTLDFNYREQVEEIYGLISGNKKSSKELSEELKISKQALSLRKSSICRKLEHISRKIKMFYPNASNFENEETIREEFIRMLVDTGVIFKPAKGYEELPFNMDVENFRNKMAFYEGLKQKYGIISSREELQEKYDGIERDEGYYRTIKETIIAARDKGVSLAEIGYIKLEDIGLPEEFIKRLKREGRKTIYDFTQDKDIERDSDELEIEDDLYNSELTVETLIGKIDSRIGDLGKAKEKCIADMQELERTIEAARTGDMSITYIEPETSEEIQKATPPSEEQKGTLQEGENQNLENTRLDDFGLSTRAYLLLARANIHIVGELAQMTEAELQNIRGMGVRALKEIVEKLAEHGLTLRDDKLSVRDLGLPPALYNSLTEANIHTVDELVQMTEEQVKNIRAIGSGSLKKIVRKLAEHGLTLRSKEETLDNEQAAETSEVEGIIGEDKLSLNDLGLPIRLYNSLVRANIHTVDDLVQMTEEEVKTIRAIGSESLEKIVGKLAEHGLTLRSTEETLDNEQAVETPEVEGTAVKDKSSSKQLEIAKFMKNARKLAKLDERLEQARKENNEVEMQRIKFERDKVSKEIQDYLSK